jgi:predicted RNase H-like nuclease (RuvC/YqgF family)
MMVWHRAQRARPSGSAASTEVAKPEPHDWKAFARAFLKLKQERDHLQRENKRLNERLERLEVRDTAHRSRLASMAEENGEGGW